MAALKNPRKEQFAQKYAESGKATEAMLEVYPSRSRWKKESQWAASSNLVNDPLVSARVDEIKEELKAKRIISMEEILDICARVIRGENITDFKEGRAGKADKARTISKTWAIERVCRLLGLDQAVKMEVTNKDKDTRTREEKIADIQRLQQSRK